MKNLLQYALLCMFCLSIHAAFAQSKNNAAIAVKLNHIGVYVTDLAVSTAFYENILSLEQIPEPFHDGRHTWFTIGAAGHLHLIQGEKKVYARDRNDHLCFSVQSIEAFIVNLDKNKIEYTNWPGTAKEPTVRPDGVKQIYFTDPDGHLIEINNDTSVK
ncbi:MAG: VOC family protein [Cyclobacteriaceae bacterium]|nr:VOC family protein [Cyclobacteriaceae bacterium]MDH4295834.1 VOC family protein [Cyclobacteriaceae bacterium]MDH5247679.1 VOC family protein [Cyclobacteriaceae bacterium]